MRHDSASPPAPASPASRSPLDRIAHDLRTPITGIAAHLDLLARGTDGPLTQAQRARLDRMRAILARMTAMTRQISEIADLESGRLRIDTRPVDLGEVILIAIEEAERAAGLGPLNLRLDLPSETPAVRTDPYRLRRILVILMLDAIGRADAGAGLVITISPAEGGMIRLALSLESNGGATGDGLVHDASPGLGRVVAEGIARALGGTLHLPAREDVRGLAALCLPAAGPAERPAGAGPAETDREAAEPAARDQRV